MNLQIGMFKLYGPCQKNVNHEIIVSLQTKIYK